MFERKGKLWFPKWPQALSSKTKLPSQRCDSETEAAGSLTDICDESGMFIESKLDLNEILSPTNPSSPSRPATLETNQSEMTGRSRRFSSESPVDLQNEKHSTSFSDSFQSVSSAASPLFVDNSDKAIRKNKSLGDFSRHFRRSPKSAFSCEAQSPTKGSESSELSDHEIMPAPIPLSELRVKHGLPPVTQLSRIHIDPTHPHHPFEWSSRNLWCMNCTTIDAGTPWAKRTIPKWPQGNVRKAKLGPETPPSRKPSVSNEPAPDAYRDIPLQCSICQCTCCVYGEKKLTLIKTDKRNVDITILSTKERGLLMRTHREASKALYEIEASCLAGRDPRTFVHCMEAGCRRLVCPDCAARCDQLLCSLIFCRNCWPEQAGRCRIHHVSEDKHSPPRMPTRPPPAPPASSLSISSSSYVKI